jgi:hypothetical protein
MGRRCWLFSRQAYFDGLGTGLIAWPGTRIDSALEQSGPINVFAYRELGQHFPCFCRERIGNVCPVPFLAHRSLNAREYIVNLKGVAVSSVCYYSSILNECSSFAVGSVTCISDLIWLAKLMYERGEPW